MLLTMRTQLQTGELSAADADTMLADYGVCMVDPATGGVPVDGGISPEMTLCESGDSRLVTAETLEEYFGLLAQSWFGAVSAPTDVEVCVLSQLSPTYNAVLAVGRGAAGGCVQRGSAPSPAVGEVTCFHHSRIARECVRRECSLGCCDFTRLHCKHWHDC
jgi:hypothetical protein